MAAGVCRQQALREIWDKTMQQTLIYVNAWLRRGKGTKSRALIHKLIDRSAPPTSHRRAPRRGS